MNGPKPVTERVRLTVAERADRIADSVPPSGSNAERWTIFRQRVHWELRELVADTAEDVERAVREENA